MRWLLWKFQICSLICVTVLAGKTSVTDREYVGTVSEVKINEKFAAVRCANVVQLHRVNEVFSSLSLKKKDFILFSKESITTVTSKSKRS